MLELDKTITVRFNERDITIPQNIIRKIKEGLEKRHTDKIHYLVGSILWFNPDGILGEKDFIKWRMDQYLTDEIITNLVTLIILEYLGYTVEIKKVHTNEGEEDFKGKYGGELTYAKDLPLNEKFYVQNGCWEGQIVKIRDNKYLQIGDDIITEVDEDMYFWI